MKKLRESRQARQLIGFEVTKALEYLKNKGLIVKDKGQGLYQISGNPDNLGYIYLGTLDIQADEYEITGRDTSVIWKGRDWEEFMDDVEDFINFDAGVPYQPNNSERDQNLQELLKKLDAEDFTTMIDRAGRVIVDFDIGSFDIDYIEGEWVYVVHYSGEFYEFTIYREWADDVVSIIQSVSEDDAEQWAQEYVNEKGPFDESAKRYSRKSIKESEGVEIYPEDGKLKAKAITKKVVSNKTKNKLSDLEVKDATRDLSPKEKKATKAVIKDLKAKGKLKDISDEFDVDPKPDLTFKANGDVEVTPDSGKKSYTIPEKEVEKFEEAFYEGPGYSNIRNIAKKKIRNLLDKEGIDYDDGSQCISCPIITGNDIGWSNIEKAKAWFAKKGMNIGFATIDGLYYYGFVALDDEDAQARYDTYMEGKDEDDDDFSDFDADLLICWY